MAAGVVFPGPAVVIISAAVARVLTVLASVVVVPPTWAVGVTSPAPLGVTKPAVVQRLTRDAAATSRAIAGLLQTAIRSRVSYTKSPALTLLKRARPRHRLVHAIMPRSDHGVARSHMQRVRSRANAVTSSTATQSRASTTKPPASTLLRSARPRHRLGRAATATLTLGVARSRIQRAP